MKSLGLLKIGIVMLIMAMGIFYPSFGICNDDFDRFIMPVSNPIYLGDARNVTMIRPLYLFQRLPQKVDTIIGKVPLGGHINGFAIQASYAFNDRLSLVAVKDGYIDCRPNNTLNDHNGWTDIAAGLQYSFLYHPQDNFIMTARLVYEMASGSDQVYQGNGDGNFNPSILFLKGIDRLQFSGALGLVVPVDRNQENTLFYDSWHLDYAVTDWFRPLVELNHFYVIDSGDRDPWIRNAINKLGVERALSATLGTSKEDDVVASVAKFNGCDIVDLGGRYNDDHRNLVTLAFGSRFRVTNWLDFGAAYEIPLTSKEDGLIRDRLMLDAIVTLKF
ncbi:MAG: hypothetical protein ACP5SG_05350 [Dissulfurimicrobium sp.]|uniref:hypothetical protein n=1 Tax=Dissulfurimicrobium sp. TaxID=2022436 RepID=UPI003D0CC273